MNIYKQTCYLICYRSLYVDKRYDREITAENSQLEKKLLNTVVLNHFHSVKKNNFRPSDHMISMEYLALNFPCQCTQQKLQAICAVLTFDPQLKKNPNIFCKRQISIKLFYLYQRLQCRDKYFFKIKFVFFPCLRLSASSKENLYVYISDIRQIVGYRTPVFIQRFPCPCYNYL